MAEIVRDYFERTKLIVHGAPDSMEERRARWCALIIDGRPFGEHDTSEPRFEEKAELAMVLVSCDVDREVACVRRLQERSNVHTPDFEARLHDGRAVRIEVTQFNDQDAMTYQNQWNAVFDIVQTRVKEHRDLTQRLQGLGIVFDLPNASPPYDIKQAGAEEILAILCDLDPSAARGRAIVISDAFPLLHHCGASYYMAETNEAETRIQFSLPLGLSDVDRILDSVPVMLAKKAAKYDGYSDGGTIAVWLAVFARDEASGYNLTAIQELKRTAKAITVEPFERLMISNAVAGLLVDADRTHPSIYRSLSVPRCEIARQ